MRDFIQFENTILPHVAVAEVRYSEEWKFEVRISYARRSSAEYEAFPTRAEACRAAHSAVRLAVYRRYAR